MAEYSPVRITFVTNFCPHYRISTFETLAQRADVEFLFFSAGREWYWQGRHGLRHGAFRFEYLNGIDLGPVRLVPALAMRLWRGRYDVVIKCIQGRFALPISYIVSRLRRRPFILWTGVWMRIQTPAHRLFFPITRYLYTHADAVVVYGEHVKRYLTSEGVKADRIFVAPHAVDNPAYAVQVPPADIEALRTRLAIAVGQPVVLFLGRLEDSKGLDVLLAAFARVANPTSILLIAGEGTERSTLEARVTGLGLGNRVRFAGYVKPEHAVVYYALAQCLVLPSVSTPTAKEPWGLVVNEAFNQGLPVIASDAVGAAAGGLVRHGENGLVVPERNVPALTEAIDAIVRDDALRQRMSHNARTLIATWNNERMVDGFMRAVDFVSRRSGAAQPSNR